MIDYFSTEFWIVVLFFIIFFLMIFVFLLLKRVNRLNIEMFSRDMSYQDSDENNHAEQSARDILEMLEPLVEESKKAALSFEEQVTEKKRLLKELNDALDSRVISINLLLSRADAFQKQLEEKQHSVISEPVTPASYGGAVSPNHETNPLLDQQHQIIDMYRRNMDVDTIAGQLSIPKGEIQLVIDLKKKFLAMEKDNR